MSITASSLSQCIENLKISYIIQNIYNVICIALPEFCFILPIIAYEIIQNENKYLKFTFIFPLLYFFTNSSIINSILVFACIVVALLISLYNSTLENIQKKLILQRDSLIENKLLLTERNKYLTDNRDYEINLAILTERTRIAREIHDNVGHMLSRTLLQLGAVKIINKDENIKLQLDEINNSINTAMTSIRKSVHNLHDNAILLENTIKELIKPLKKEYIVKLDMDISEDLSKEIKYCIIGIVKEAISNIICHSSADTVNILICEHPAFYQIVVYDNGKNNNKPIENGMGIENMKTRAEKLNGIFKYYITDDGFKIFSSIPKKEFNL